MMKIIGAVGRNGSGKDTVLKIIAEKKRCSLISMGDIVRNIAKEKKIPLTRENLTKIANDYRKGYGMDFFPKKVVSQISSLCTDYVCITGIRTVVDFTVIKNHFGSSFILLFVDANANIRYDRLRKRGESRDPLDFNEFLKQEESEERAFSLTQTIKLADYVINNDGDLLTLKKEIDKILEIIDK